MSIIRGVFDADVVKGRISADERDRRLAFVAPTVSLPPQ